MRILGARIFLSFLAGKLWQFEQMILAARSSFSSARSCFGGKLNRRREEKTEEKLTAILSLTVSRFKKG